MRVLKRIIITAVGVMTAATPAHAGPGDLLVAPTRIILEGERGAEVNLSNTGDDISTYRISLVLRRMDEQGRINAVDETTASGPEAVALEMISYAPRKVVLEPGKSQTVRIGVRLPPAGLPDGEYRAHMLFRAVPDVKPASGAVSDSTGLNISLTPVYGVTIPVIVRHGELGATAGIANARVVASKEGPALAFDLSRQGNRGIFGDIEVLSPGSDKAIFTSKGIAAYAEVDRRSVSLPLTDAQARAMKPGLIMRYTEMGGDKPVVVETQLTADK